MATELTLEVWRGMSRRWERRAKLHFKQLTNYADALTEVIEELDALATTGTPDIAARLDKITDTLDQHLTELKEQS